MSTHNLTTKGIIDVDDATLNGETFFLVEQLGVDVYLQKKLQQKWLITWLLYLCIATSNNMMYGTRPHMVMYVLWMQDTIWDWNLHIVQAKIVSQSLVLPLAGAPY